MAIGERKACSAVVIRGWIIHDLSAGRSWLSHLHGAGRVVDAIWMFVDHHPGLSWNRDIGEFAVDLVLATDLGTGQPLAEIEDLAHGLASNPRDHLAGRVLNQNRIGRTLPDLQTISGIPLERALGDGVRRVPVVPITRRIIEAAVHEESAARIAGDERTRERLNEQFIFILRVELPGESHLAAIIHAGDAFGFALCLGKGWKQHAGKNRDDRDNHQQLDQGKAA